MTGWRGLAMTGWEEACNDRGERARNDRGGGITSHMDDNFLTVQWLECMLIRK